VSFKPNRTDQKGFTEAAPQLDGEEWFDAIKTTIIASYTKHMFETLSKDVKVAKNDCFQWASDYRLILVR